MIYLILSFVLSAQAGELESKLQRCFDRLGYEKFKVIAYSEDSRTLVYELNGETTIILREDSGSELTAAPANSCKPLQNGGSIRKLAQAFVDKTKERRSQKNSQDLKICAEALRGLKLSGDAAVLESHLTPAPASSSPTSNK